MHVWQKKKRAGGEHSKHSPVCIRPVKQLGCLVAAAAGYRRGRDVRIVFEHNMVFLQDLTSAIHFVQINDQNLLFS